MSATKMNQLVNLFGNDAAGYIVTLENSLNYWREKAVTLAKENTAITAPRMVSNCCGASVGMDQRCNKCKDHCIETPEEEN